jgi:hypothetical protein
MLKGRVLKGRRGNLFQKFPHSNIIFYSRLHSLKTQNKQFKKTVTRGKNKTSIEIIFIRSLYESRNT